MLGIFIAMLFALASCHPSVFGLYVLESSQNSSSCFIVLRQITVSNKDQTILAHPIRAIHFNTAHAHLQRE